MTLSKSFNYSYWELKHYFKCYDLIVIGSGIVGLSTAISFKQKNKNAHVLVVERGVFLSGASTKNAGFACFGSPGELLADLEKMNEQLVWETVEMRWKGLNLLRTRLKDKNINYKAWGGFELFDNQLKLSQTTDKLPYLNRQTEQIIGHKQCYVRQKNICLSNDIKGIIKNNYEGQIDTDFMMTNLILLARNEGIDLLNGITVNQVNDLGTKVELATDYGTFTAKKVAVSTNGFAKQLLAIADVKPARAQVLITKPIAGLRIKGTFHYDEGYYYFRNIDNRLLFGGGRNLDLKKETTYRAGINLKIQRKLNEILKTVILPNTPFEVEHRWSGIMGVGKEKKPIIKPVSKNVLAAVRMGGMGIAIGSWVGEQAAMHLK